MQNPLTQITQTISNPNNPILNQQTITSIHRQFKSMKTITQQITQTISNQQQAHTQHIRNNDINTHQYNIEKQGNHNTQSAITHTPIYNQ